MKRVLCLALWFVCALSGQLLADTLMLCYGYGCKHSAAVTLTRTDWARLQALFPEWRSPTEERVAIAAAVAEFERIAGRVTPIHRDRGGNPLDALRPGQLDCIDESLNTTALLFLLEQRGLLRWHRVVERAFRAPWLLDQHWSAQIEETREHAGEGAHQRYAVDSWPRDNGQPALIQPIADWRWKAPHGEPPIHADPVGAED